MRKEHIKKMYIGIADGNDRSINNKYKVYQTRFEKKKKKKERKNWKTKKKVLVR